ncbi:hypothetical protein [Oceanimonas sp. CAM02]|uniref:hypothetical protein n=1 Tax=Oceanimonas sp. CAM02 TaxID=3080336 RepID=UPI002936B825|nr:hypothetical protein [Oceanimonas sp. CAM02]MDV2858632.1 hypothetical protein [Oceanimonas sp. CAM02]
MRLNPQAGSMLVSIIFIIVILSGLMAAMVTLSGQSSRQLVYEVQALKARLAAESVLEQQIYAVLDNFNADKVVDKDSPFFVNGCDAYIHSITPAGALQRQIISTGSCTGSGLTVVRNIEVEVINE